MFLKVLKFKIKVVFVSVISLSCFLEAQAEFVSIKTNEANLRAGPSKNYPIRWIYKIKGEPLEVIAEYDNWKKVRDFYNDTGWVHQSIVSRAKFGIIKSSVPVILFSSPDVSSKKILRLEYGVRVKIRKCEATWCNIKVDKFEGWVKNSEIWGAK